jgi:hypothetical protein
MRKKGSHRSAAISGADHTHIVVIPRAREVIRELAAPLRRELYT